VAGAVVSLAVLGAGVVMLSMWAPPAMTAEELARLPGRTRRPATAGEADQKCAFAGHEQPN